MQASRRPWKGRLVVMETLEKPVKTRGHSDRGCGEVCLESQKQINFMKISVTRKPPTFSWNLGTWRKPFQPGANLGSKEKRISFLMEQKS